MLNSWTYWSQKEHQHIYDYIPSEVLSKLFIIGNIESNNVYLSTYLYISVCLLLLPKLTNTYGIVWPITYGKFLSQNVVCLRSNVNTWKVQNHGKNVKHWLEWQQTRDKGILKANEMLYFQSIILIYSGITCGRVLNGELVHKDYRS